MNPRFEAVRDVTFRKIRMTGSKGPSVDIFGELCFNRKVMEKMLPKEINSHLDEVLLGRGKFNVLYADIIAQAMKDWAINLGATHFCHWFQPLTGLSAEKQDAFLDWKTLDSVLEKFSGKQLMGGEPDASSFPSGGLRATHSARGYTSWDPSSYAFIWKSSGSSVLCIPSVFFSWTGDALDAKIPLLRSDAKINNAALRLSHYFGLKATSVFSTLGCEQEYFLIDRGFYQLRPDLIMAGRTIVGAASPKSQELEDHYFGAIKERVLAYMREFEEEAVRLGIPIKTRHNEVAPGQFEVAPIFERASLAVDHNILLMELMRQVARRHDLACLLHEKPFAGINGSGKHNNWSLATDTGLNLLDPTDSPENSLPFLVLLAAILKAVHKHAPLLRASIASAGNDHRLGGHEAPPVIISVYLGEELERVLDMIETGKGDLKKKKQKLDLGIPMIAELAKDTTDRNRTSPFAFTGNKFEFRAVGSSANCSLPISVLNVIVAMSLNEIMDQLGSKKDKEHVFAVLRKVFKETRPIRFSGNNYSPEWVAEAKKRKLPIINKSLDAFKVLEEKGTKKVFEGVLTSEELDARYEILSENYAKVKTIEAKLLLEIFHTQILPVALQYQKELASIPSHKKKLTALISTAIKKMDLVEKTLLNIEKLDSACRDARASVDAMEQMIDDRLWPLPKYREMLMIL